MEPKVLLLDEPTAGLDDHTKEKLKKVLAGLNLSYILISHELDFLADITDSIYTMVNGKIFSDEQLLLHQHYHTHPHASQPHKHK